MGIYYAIFAIAGLINLVGFIWLVIVGFQRSVLWGILIFLFSPLAAIIFAITNWFDAKKPFLIYLLSSIVFIATIFMLLSQVGMSNLEKLSTAIESGEIDPNEAYGYLQESESEGAEQQDPQTDPALLTDEQGTEVPQANGQDATEAGAVTTETTETIEQPEAEEESSALFPSPGEVQPDPLAAKKQKRESPFVPVKLENIANYVGRYFVVVTKELPKGTI